MRVAIYSRYSSDLQKASSIEGQIRVCRERAEREGWTMVGVYTDYTVTGAFMNRAGIQQLRQDLAAGKFDVILAEALDRLSRDQEDVAGFYKRAQFAGVRIFTLTEGEITSLHIGLKGTMNALMLSDMKEKVRRGQRGRVEVGKIGGGNCFGYRVVKRVTETNEVTSGERRIEPEEADIVRRIFREFADGKSPRKIASDLNRDGIPGPRGRKNGEDCWREGKWQQSTIYGNWQRGSGILNNELFRGVIVWNKVSYPSNPETGRPVARVNPESEWIRMEVSELRIIDEELWQAVKGKQKRTRTSSKKFWQHQRPEYLFSGLIKCGCCGGGFGKISTFQYGCSAVRNKGEAVCENRRNIRQDELELTVLNALQARLMDPALFEVFCKEYTAHLNRLRDEREASRKRARRDIERLRARATRIVRMAIDGYGSDALKVELKEVESKANEMEALLQEQPEAPNVRLHPDMAHRYRQEVTALIRMFREDSRRHEASGLIRGLIEKIVLVPDPNSDRLLVNLHGELAGILNLAESEPEMMRSEEELTQIRLVAGLDQIKHMKQGRFRMRERRHASSTSTLGAGRGGKLVGPGGLEPPTRPL